MPRLPDRFDLWVKKARESPDPSRQVDYVLGALVSLNHWYFLDIGSKENPQPAEVEIENHWYKLVFSDLSRIEDILPPATPPQVISMPAPAAMTWCLTGQAAGCAGLLLNPGDYAALIPMPQLEAFHAEWTQRGSRQASGYWIPNLTTEEDDFWQQHGI